MDVMYGLDMVSINEVTPRWAWLVLGWVIHVWGSTPGAKNLSQYITSHPGQLSLAIPSRAAQSIPAKGH